MENESSSVSLTIDEALNPGLVVWKNVVGKLKGFSERLAARVLPALCAELRQKDPRVTAEMLDSLKRFIPDGADIMAFARLVGLEKYVIDGPKSGSGGEFDLLARAIGSPSLMEFLCTKIPSLKGKIENLELSVLEFNIIKDIVDGIRAEPDYVPCGDVDVDALLSGLRATCTVNCSMRGDNYDLAQKRIGEFLLAWPTLQRHGPALCELVKGMDGDLMVFGEKTLCRLDCVTGLVNVYDKNRDLELYMTVPALLVFPMMQKARREFINCFRHDLNEHGSNDVRILLGLYVKEAGPGAPFYAPIMDLPCCYCNSIDMVPLSSADRAAALVNTLEREFNFCTCRSVERMARAAAARDIPEDDLNDYDEPSSEVEESGDDLDETLAELSKPVPQTPKRSLPVPSFGAVPSAPARKKLRLGLNPVSAPPAASPDTTRTSLEAISSWLGNARGIPFSRKNSVRGGRGF